MNFFRKIGTDYTVTWLCSCHALRTGSHSTAFSEDKSTFNDHLQSHTATRCVCET